MSKLIATVVAAVVAVVLLVGPLVMGLAATLFGASSSQQQNSCFVLAAPGEGSWVQPTIDADGLVGSPFGPRFHPILKIWRMHNGVDLGNASGTPIWAVAAGTVTSVARTSGGGNAITIDHGGGIVTAYLHLLDGSTRVSAGQQVTAGTQIAQMGSTGLSTAPHLHFEVRSNGTPTDPVPFLTERGVNVVSTAAPTRPAVALAATTDTIQGPTAAGSPTTLTSRTTTGTEITVNQQQLALAATIIGAGQTLGVPPRGLQVALMTALQESTMGANRSTRSPNTDHDVGPFQQRALLGWYAPQLSYTDNVAWLNDARNSATVFFQGQVVSAQAHAAAVSAGRSPAGPIGYRIPGLLSIPGWDSMSLAAAAQKVQASAFPDAYAKWEPVAADILSAVHGIQVPGGGCGAAAGGVVYAGGEFPQSERPVGSEVNLTPATIIVKRAIAALFPEISSIGGWRASSAIATSDHPVGRAIDVMIDNYRDPAQIALGDRVAQFAIANHANLKIKYVIWRQRIWTPSNPTWRPMADRGSITQNHYDHVHVSVLE